MRKLREHLFRLYFEGVDLILIIIYSKQFQRSLGKQGLKFMLNTKVLSAEKRDGKVYIKTEAAKVVRRKRYAVVLPSHFFSLTYCLA